MTEDFAQFGGGIPRNYDEGLGPHIFIDYARELAVRAQRIAPSQLLEIAAGTGILTASLCEALGESVHVTATDLNTPMLEVAQEKVGQRESIVFQPADATELPFEPGAFDTVVCQFGLMFFPDKDRSAREVYRVLKPGGIYLFNVWDSFDHNPFARVAHETFAGFFPEDPPGFYKVPFSYHDPAPIEASLAAAGFEDISFEWVPLEKEIHDAELFARGIVFGNPSIDEIRARGADPDAVMTTMVEALRREFGPEPGRMSLRAIVFTARKPD